MNQILISLGILIFLFSCSQKQEQPIVKSRLTQDSTIYTAYSSSASLYRNFDSQKAINKIADIENKHFRAYHSDQLSKFYGTQWRKKAEANTSDTKHSEYEAYTQKLTQKPDSMHCTIYAVEALKEGLDTLWNDLEAYHKTIYADHEHAGWSIGHILVKHFGWEAHLIINESSPEFNQCQNHFKKHKSYPVYNQPDIPLKSFLVMNKQDSMIQKLLNKHEFSWGFSYQGWHTWITRYSALKECIWHGAPSKSHEKDNLPLFRETPFLNYMDYDSHVLVFPKLN